MLVGALTFAFATDVPLAEYVEVLLYTHHNSGVLPAFDSVLELGLASHLWWVVYSAAHVTFFICVRAGEF